MNCPYRTHRLIGAKAKFIQSNLMMYVEHEMAVQKRASGSACARLAAPLVATSFGPSTYLPWMLSESSRTTSFGTQDCQLGSRRLRSCCGAAPCRCPSKPHGSSGRRRTKIATTSKASGKAMMTLRAAVKLHCCAEVAPLSSVHMRAPQF